MKSILTFFAASLAAMGVATAGPLGLGTSPPGTLAYTLAATYAKALQDAAKQPALVQPSSGTGVMIPLVDSGELDIGFCNTLELSEAYRGVGSFDGRPQKNIRAMAVLFPIQVGFFVKKDSPIKSIKDLKGKKIAWGYTSQAIIQTIVEGVLADGGVAAADMQKVLVPNLIRGADEFAAGSLDAGFFALGQAKISEVAATVGGVRFLPLDDSPAAVAALRKFVPPGYVATLDPAPGNDGVDVPTKLLFYDYTAFVNASLSDDTVKQLTAVMIEQKGAMAKSMALFTTLDTGRTYRDLDVPYHAGAAAYFKDKAIALSH